MGFAQNEGNGYGSVMNADNVSFDGTTFGGVVTQNGQLLIGSSSTPHIRTGFITSTDGSIGITNTAGNINLTGGNAAPFVPNAVLQEFDDFISSGVSFEGGSASSKLRWGRASSSADVFQSNGTASHPGIWTLSTSVPGVNTNLWLKQEDTSNVTNICPFILGGGILTINWVIRLATLSSGGNTYRFSCGLADNTTLSANSDSYVDGCYFTYTNTVNSGNWQIKNTAASVTTTGSTSIAASTSFVTLSIVVNAAGTSVAYYIDGNQVSVSPLTTNIPSATLTPFVNMINTAGTNPNLEIDLFWCTNVLSNPRPGPTNASGSTTRTLIRQYTPTATSYQVLGTDSVIGVTNTGAARTITMPLAPTTGQEWTIKDVSLGAATNNITINGNGWNILSDASAGTYVINTNGGSAEIFFDGTEFLII